MSFIPVTQYLIGLGVFGFMYWLLDGIMDMFIEVNVHTNGTTFNIIHAFFTGGLLVYVIFGGWWVIRKYNEKDTQGGMY